MDLSLEMTNLSNVDFLIAGIQDAIEADCDTNIVSTYDLTRRLEGLFNTPSKSNAKATHLPYAHIKDHGTATIERYCSRP
jgi:hypothetical protein